MLTSVIGRALVVGAFALTAAPSFAASSTTEIYLANVRIHADILAASDKLAGTKAQSDALKRFADNEAKHQGDVVAALDGWRAAEEGATPAQVASLPLETGRSVAIDPPIATKTYAPPPGVGVLLAGASATLDHLSSLDGAAFDGSFKTTQLGALKTLEGLYDSYSHTGDNAALRDMAVKELAEVRAEIAALDQA